MNVIRIFLFGLSIVTTLSVVYADPGDTTTITTFTQEFVNWADPHVASFYFPAGREYSQITLHLTLGCPGSPGDCDPWDRLGQLFILVPLTDSTDERYEIARFITPYDITGGGGPGSCSWDYDVTDYQTLLHDSVTFSLYITTWIGGNRGWLITATFECIEGQPDLEPYRVINLWDFGYLVYGDPDNPPEDHILSIPVATDPLTDQIKVRVTCTGHGQGNTHNAAEFSNKWHRVWAGIDFFEHNLWRGDCSTNPCSPQGGTWEYPRAGWCPGASVPPWDNYLENFSPGETVDFYYEIQPYENLCRPTNPNCVSGQTCADCNYNYTGHTEPNYCLTAQAFFYRAPTAVDDERQGLLPESPRLAQNYPNPFNPITTIGFSLPNPGLARLTVYNVAGEIVAQPMHEVLSAGSYELSFDGSTLASGLYFYTLDFHGRRLTHKMLLLK